MTKAVTLPNIRKLFIPDPGYIMFDCDLAGADAQVVAWEANDDDLKAAFRAGLDVHSKNGEDLWGSSFTSLAPDSYARYEKRQQTKKGVHAANYASHPRTIATSLGWTVHEAETFVSRWFSLHPKIKDWHTRVQHQLDRDKTITNSFGYRRVFFDRPDACFPEALAWVPQSTVALVSFRGAIQLEQRCPWVEMLLQNHDSLVFQVPKPYSERHEEIRSGLSITCPYPDPLTIPWGISKSAISWGDCQKVDLRAV